MSVHFEPVSPHIFKLDLRCWGVVPTGVWLIEHDGAWTLVDAGPRSQARRLIAALRAHLGQAPLARAILTHGHEDHAGGLAAVLEHYDCPVWAHPLEAPFLTGKKRYAEIESVERAYRFGRQFLKVNYHFRVDRELGDQEMIDDCRVLHVPGHTPGQIALHHLADRAVICGDAFVNLIRLGKPFAFATPDPTAARESMNKIAALDFDLLLVSHGKPFLRGKRAATSPNSLAAAHSDR